MTTADGEQISHLVTMIHMTAVSDYQGIAAETGYLDRLQIEINNGGFAASGTLEIMMLEKSEQYLRQTADKIEQARLSLLVNSVKSRPKIVSSSEQF